ncbi:MAG: glycerophosphodiester phosphodiesterase [Clostridia bacterium]|nr:glycerophosphodiester phosphodiesterase [Clostridia bacterium]
MPHEIFLAVSLSLIGAVALALVIYLLLIRTKREGEIMRAYRGVSFAHRGLHGEGRAENSLSAFSAAAEEGFGIELDVRLSKDGKLVVFHDDTLTRVAGIDERVDAKTLEELRKCRLSGTNDTIPTFREVLELIDGRVPLLIEIKEDAGNSRVTETLVEELRGYNGPYIVESFNPLSLKAFRRQRRDVPIGILSQHFCRREEYRGKILYFVLQNMLLNFLSAPDFVAYDHTDANMPSLKLARAVFGTPAVAWTVRREEEEMAARAAGFGSVIFEGYLPKEGRARTCDLPRYVN